MKSLGLCIGASNISLAIIERNEREINIIEGKSIPHGGNPRKIIKSLFQDDLIDSIDNICVTGKKLRTMLNLSSISEPEALEYAYSYYRYASNSKANIIISAGGENFILYKLDDMGKIIDVQTGNKCASGTGEFFLQQIKRMGLDAETAIELADMENPYNVAGRCSVFCKSDCTHALNKGIPKGKVVSGLCRMMATKILELLKDMDSEKVLLVGGVSQNKVMVDYLRKKIPNLIIPPHSTCFEALGAALWASFNETKPIPKYNDIFIRGSSSFNFLPAIKDFSHMVTFKEMVKREALEGDECIIGLDVGSTTTKAVLMRKKDDAILASCYIRTNGDPIGASKKCYEELDKQIKVNINIVGLGVTGSGRQIAGLHALTNSIVNEITAHAKASVYFGPEVDTIFEIGGQDAKYTYLTNGVPCDYAMNEACSAGTGSFLEEAARESLNVDTYSIGEIALKSTSPPNFSDQCAAFISSDIKNAIQEGISREDIIGGLVYSICQNYINRVKGSRKVGSKVFMQGGVCYNKAVPLAMAAITGKEIVVPPEPGLMGAFGVALVVKERLNLGIEEPKAFNLKELSNRNVSYREPFTCSGGKEKCDRKCTINRIEIEGEIYSFGGACSKYYNMKFRKEIPLTQDLDLVALRERLLFEKYGRLRGTRLVSPKGKRVGINNSLLTNALFPLYYNFFTALGYEVVIPKELSKEGIDRKGASFCYPAEISHGAIQDLIDMKPDIIFLPHVKSLEVKNSSKYNYTCPFVQGEPYYLKATFKELERVKVLSPVLEFSQGIGPVKKAFMEMGRNLGEKAEIVEKAFDKAIKAQMEFQRECKAIGENFLKALEKSDNIGIVLFGRPYNAFSKLGNMGIPHKFASLGYRIIPHDFLPFEDLDPYENMYWAMGQMILKAGELVKKHPRLFGVYITNFSCGPDSFVVGYFRNIMGDKPSLTLELDGHTADAGIDTRIEAFLDVVKSYLEIKDVKKNSSSFRRAEIVNYRKGLRIIDSKGESYSLLHPRVHVLIPSMGDFASKLLASTFRYTGVNSTPVPKPTELDLKKGQGQVSCKECLPLIITTGSLLNYLNSRKNRDELLVYFMPEASGPCRFGQYNVLIKDIIEKNQIENVAVLSLTSENSYAGLGTKFALRAWQSVILSDIMEEIYSAILTTAIDKDEALTVYEEVCNDIAKGVATQKWKDLKNTLHKAVEKLNTIDIKAPVEKFPKVGLIGEIYVRRDDFSRQYLVERLAERDIIIKTAPVSEWIYYVDYLLKNNILPGSTFDVRLKTYIQGYFKNYYERAIKEIFSKSKFYEYHLVDVDRIVNSVSDLISLKLTGETILTVGTAILEIVEEVSGIISIGPFGCMPSRMAEAIIKEKIDEKKGKVAIDKKLVDKVMETYPNLPFLSIEADGNPFPQIVESKLEAFCLQVNRIHNKIMKVKGKGQMPLESTCPNP